MTITKEKWIEEKAKRIGDWIWQLSPHNRWKAKEAIYELISDTAKNARKEEEGKWRKIMLKILKEGHGGGNWRRVIEQNIS